MNIYHLCGGTIAVIILAYLLDRVRIKFVWNNGKCRKTGEPWVYSGYDEHACVHVYKTASGRNVVFDQEM